MKHVRDTRPTRRRLGILGLALFVTPLVLSADGTGEDELTQGRNRYIGAARCRNCHRAEESGNQFGIWEEKPHAKAFDTLASETAKKYAADRGIADPQKSEECMKCHDTGFGLEGRQLHRTFKPELGVQCESCHGPGETHQRARLAAAATEEEPASYTVISDDEIIKVPPMDTCLKCHNDESPGFKPFCFHEFAGSIRHLNPLKPRTDEEKAAILVCGCEDPCTCVNGCEEGKCGIPPDKK